MENQGPSYKQVEFIKKLVDRHQVAMPVIDDMSMDDAKKWISGVLAKNGQPPKTVGDVVSGDSEAVDLLRQILAELKHGHN